MKLLRCFNLITKIITDKRPKTVRYYYLQNLFSTRLTCADANDNTSVRDDICVSLYKRARVPDTVYKRQRALVFLYVPERDTVCQPDTESVFRLDKLTFLQPVPEPELERAQVVELEPEQVEVPRTVPAAEFLRLPFYRRELESLW